MLAHVVLLDQKGIHRRLRIDTEGYEGHLGALLHHLGVVDSVIGRGAPRERTMILDQNGWSMVGVDLADVQDLVDNDVARLEFVLSLDLSLGHVAGARNILVEVVGMCRSDVGNVSTSLSKGCGVGRVGVNDSLDVGEGPVEHQVSGRVARAPDGTNDLVL